MRSVLAAAASAAAVVCLFPVESVAQPTSLSIFVGASDYPEGVTPDSVARNVTLRYRFAEAGRPEQCRIVRSSGNPALDEASCQILVDRGTGTPHVPRRGRATFTWLPQASGDLGNSRGAPLSINGLGLRANDYPRELAMACIRGDVRFQVAVSALGNVENCQINQSSGHQVLDRLTCEIVTERSQFIPASDGRGGSAPGSYRGRISWRSR